MMRFREYRFLVRSDLYRYAGKVDSSTFLVYFLLNAGFKSVFWMRTCHYLYRNSLLRQVFLPIAKLFSWRYLYKFGIHLPYRLNVGSGLYIGHFGGIFINYRARIGRNCNISQGVTIGQVNRGRNKGFPVIGDNVYIGPGAKVIGNVRVGSNVAIGSNCVVCKDVPDNAVVVGIPCRVISMKGSADYVNRTDYEEVLASKKNGGFEVSPVLRESLTKEQ